MRRIALAVSLTLVATAIPASAAGAPAADQARLRDRAGERGLRRRPSARLPRRPTWHRTLPQAGPAADANYYGIGHAQPRQLHRDDQRPGPQPADPGRLPALHRLPAGHDRRRRPGHGHGLRLPHGGQDGRRPAGGQGPHLEAATWRTWATTRARGGDLRAPGGQQRDGPHAGGDGQGPVRHAPQPVRLLPLDHRLARLRSKNVVA